MENATENRIEKKSGGILGKIVALLIGLILGIITGIGGLIGGGYIIVTQVKIQDGVDTANGFIDPDIIATDFVTEEYAQKTLYDTFTAIIAASQQMQEGTGTLQSLADISPLVVSTLDGVVASAAEIELYMETEELLARPVGELGDYVKECVGEMEIRALVENFGSEMDSSDPIMQALLYGAKGVNYTVDLEGNVIMLPVYFTFDGTLNAFTNQDEKAYVFSTGTNTYLAEDGEYIKAYTGTDGYAYELYDEDDTLIYQLKLSSSVPNLYEAYFDGEQALHKPHKIGPVLSGEQALTDLFNGVYVGDFFSVNADSNKVLIALAYGEPNVDYIVNEETREIIPINEPTKLGDFTGGNIEDVFANIPLDSVVTIDLTNNLVKAIAYGNKNHYTVDGETVTMNQVRYDVETDGSGEYLVDFGTRKKITGAVKDGSSYVITDEDGNVTYAIYDDGIAGYYAWRTATADEGTEVYYKKTSVMDMKNGIDDAINEVTIGDLVKDIGPDDTLLNAIKDWGINELTDNDKLMSLTLGQVLTIEDNDHSILRLLKDEPIGSLSESINKVSLLAYLEAEEGVFVLKTNGSGEYVNTDGVKLYYSAEKKAYYTSADFNDASISDPVYLDASGNELSYDEESKVWYYMEGATKVTSKRALMGSWYYMFTDPDGLKDQESYSIGDMTLLIENMTENINHATIGDLADKGILDVSTDTLNKDIVTTDGTKKIRDLKVSEALDVLAAVGSVTP